MTARPDRHPRPAPRPAARFPALAAAGLLVLTVLAGGGAGAATMTFSGLGGDPSGPPSPYVEDGIVATGDVANPAFHTVPGALHLDDSGTPFPSSVAFTMTRRFDAARVDILPIVPTAYCAEADCETAGDAYENVLWEGERGGAVVASNRFFMGTTPSLYTFGSAFENLDRLTVTALLPDFAAIGGECFDAPCAHFDVDNLVLNPVPLPAGLWLLVSGIGILAGARLRRRGPAAA